MKKNLLVLTFFLIISVTLIFSWFRFGLIFGGGDVGLQTYNPKWVLEKARFVWWDSIAPGTTIPQGLTAVPFQVILSILQLVGFSPVWIQATFFFVILFSMGFGMFLLIRTQVNQKYIFAILGGAFYMLNPYMMIQVWHRFVHSSFFLVAALPFLVLFWMKWLESKKIIFLLSFLLTNLLAVYLFGTIAFIVTVWLFLFLITLGIVIFPWEGFKKFTETSARFLIGLVFWILTNIWWFMPVFSIAPGLLSVQHSSEESLVTLINISRQAMLPYSLQMVNPFYLFLQLDFGTFYQNFLIRLIPWIFVSIILIGFVVGLKQQKFVKWSLIFLMVAFLAKGAAPPFGFSFIFGFEHFFPLGVLRNPFEKMGILLPFIGSILLVLSTTFISDYLEKQAGKKYAFGFLALLFILIFIFCWPMFNPGIFGKIDQPSFVKVPQTYLQADQWIKTDYERKNQKGLGKILHLPLTRGESISYKWEYGYNGIEPSDLFFTTLPSISRGFNLTRLDDSLTALYLSFHKLKDNPDKILELLQNFNVRYIVLHKDVNWLGGDLFDPLESEEILNNLYFLDKVQTFGDLVIYKIQDEYFKSRISIVSNFQLIYPSDHSLIWPYLLGNEDTMITPVDKKGDDISSSATGEIIFPNSSFIYPKKSFVLAVVNQLATNETTLNLLLSQFTKIKPVLIQNGEIQSQELNNKIISSTETIVKMLRAQLMSGAISKELLTDYQQHINNILAKDLRDSRLLLYLNESDMSLIFQIHLSTLETLNKKADPDNKVKLDKIRDRLNSWMIKNDLIPKFSLQLEGEQKIDRQKLFKFQVPKNGQYEILMIDTADREILQDSFEKFKFSINGKIKEFEGKDGGEFMTFGNYELQEGAVEFGYDVITSLNLAQPFEKLIKVGNINLADDAIIIEPQGQFGYIESAIPHARGGNVYRISFEVLAQNSEGFYFQLAQDTDSLNEQGQRINQLNEFIPLTAGNWQGLQFSLNSLKLTTQNAAIRFVVVSNGQIPPAKIHIKNLKIEKVLNSDIVLRSVEEKTGVGESSGQVLDIERSSPVLYKGKVELKSPSFLTFSETYHPGWRLRLTDGKNEILPQEHVIANLYGNGWYIKDIGSFDFILEFEPQRYVYLGAIIATLSYLGLFILIGWRKFKK